MTVKEQLKRVIDSLPDDARIEDILERLNLLYRIQQGIAQDEAGETVGQEEAEKRISKWFR